MVAENMKSPREFCRKVVTFLVWLILLLGVLQEGTLWCGRLYAVRRYGFSGQLRLHLLSLSADSASGKLSLFGTSVEWKRAEFSLGKGLKVAELSLGNGASPAAHLEGIRLRRLGPLFEGSVAEAVVNPENPAWRRIVASSRQAPNRNNGGIPVRIRIGHMVVNAPGGAWSGSVSLFGEGDGSTGILSSTMTGPRHLVGELSGRWAPSGGSLSATILGGKEGRGCLLCSWNQDGFRLRADVLADGQHLGIDGKGRWKNGAQILLWTIGTGGKFESLPVRIVASKDDGGGITTVDIGPGSIQLPVVPISKNCWLSSVKIAVELSGYDNEDGAYKLCVNSGGLIHLKVGVKELDARMLVNLNYGTGSISTGPSVPVKDSGVKKVLEKNKQFIALFGRVFPAGGGRSNGKEKRGRGYLSVIASGEVASDGGIKFGGEAWAPGAKATFNGLYGEDGWRIGGVLGWRRDKNNSLYKYVYPLTKFKGSYSIDGGGGKNLSARLEGSGCGAWRVVVNKGSGSMNVTGANLVIAGSELRGLSGKLSASWSGGGGVPLIVNVGLKKLSTHGTGFSDIVIAGRGTQSKSNWRFSFRVPSLEGRFRGELAVSGVSPPRGTLSSAGLSLFGGELAFNALSAELTTGSGGDISWRAKSALVEGEKLGEITGTVKRSANLGGVVLSARTSHWKGEVIASLELGGDSERGDRLSISAEDISPSSLLTFLGKWVAMPFVVKGGSLDGRVVMPLAGFPEGMAFKVRANGADFMVKGENKGFHNINGWFSGSMKGKTLTCTSNKLSIEKGRLPLKLDFRASPAAMRVKFGTPPVLLGVLQDATFDFLPEYVGYGAFHGKGSVKGSLTSIGGESEIEGKIDLRRAGFTSEDKALVIRAVNGFMPFYLRLGKQPTRTMRDSGSFSTLSLGRVSYSVFKMRNLAVKARLKGESMAFRLLRGSLWKGEISGDLDVTLSEAGVDYTGGFSLRNLSLSNFCKESGSLAGALSGDMNGTLDIKSSGLGLGRVKGLLDISSDPNGAEKKRISRAFLVRLGGAHVRSLLRSHVLTYDEAKLKCGLADGMLSFYSLNVSHEANPVKALLRKDISFELRVPQNNTISIWRLIAQVKDLADFKAGPTKPVPRSHE